VSGHGLKQCMQSIFYRMSKHDITVKTRYHGVCYWQSVSSDKNQLAASAVTHL
jgi:hypothetical protein